MLVVLHDARFRVGDRNVESACRRKWILYRSLEGVHEYTRKMKALQHLQRIVRGHVSRIWIARRLKALGVWNNALVR